MSSRALALVLAACAAASVQASGIKDLAPALAAFAAKPVPVFDVAALAKPNLTDPFAALVDPATVASHLAARARRHKELVSAAGAAAKAALAAGNADAFAAAVADAVNATKTEARGLKLYAERTLALATGKENVTLVTPVPAGAYVVGGTYADAYCIIDDATGKIVGLLGPGAAACTSTGTAVTIPLSAGPIVGIKGALDFDGTTWGRFVFYVKNVTSGAVSAVKCGTAGGKAVSLLPKRAPGDELYVWSITAGCGVALSLDETGDGLRDSTQAAVGPALRSALDGDTIVAASGRKRRRLAGDYPLFSPNEDVVGTYAASTTAAAPLGLASVTFNATTAADAKAVSAVLAALPAMAGVPPMPAHPPVFWATQDTPAVMQPEQGPLMPAQMAAMTTLISVSASSTLTRGVAPPYTPSAVEPAGEWVQFTWADVPAPSPTDRIAVYWKPLASTPEPDYDAGKGGANDWAPIAYQWVAALPGVNLASGAGAVKVWLPAPRQRDVIVTYLRSNPSTTGAQFPWWYPIPAPALTQTVSADTPNAPAFPRVSFAGDGKVSLIWHTRDNVTAATTATADLSFVSSAFNGGAGCVPLPAGWGPGLWSRPDPFIHQLRGAAIAGTFPIGAINSVVLAVSAGARYTYTITTPEGVTSGTFRAPSLSTAGTTRLLITADGGHYSPWGAITPDGNVFPVMENGVSGASPHGSCLLLSMVGVYDSSIYRTAHVGGYALGASSPQAGSKNVLQAMAADVAAGDYHGLVFNGDISYARGMASEWLDWLAQAGPVIKNVVSAYAPGNHETSEGLVDTAWTGKDGAFIVDDGGEKGLAYAKLLQMPEPTGAGRFWYTARHGAATFVQLSSDQSMQPGSAQWTWLNATLAAIDRSQTPWVAVSLHRPLYADTPESGDVDVANSLINAIEPLLFAYSVDAVFTGHLHGYTRSCAAAKGTCAPAGVLAPVHVMTGNGGFKAPLYAYKTTPAWEVARSYNYGYSRATITATTFQIESVDAVTAGAPLLDSFTLTKPAGWAPDAPALRMAQYQALTSSLPVPVGFNDLTLYGTDYIVNLWSGGYIDYDPPWWCWPACVSPIACGYCLATYLGISYSNYYNFLADRYVAPGSATYNLLNAPTDRYIWTPQQSWNLTQAALAISQDIESPNILLRWFKNIDKPSETHAFQYIKAVTSPGGRMYFGP